MLKKIFIATFSPFILSTVLLAQELSVKQFSESVNDLSARTMARQDNNGNDCALIKVQLASAGVTFEGNIVGDVAFKTNEYWVYMADGSKRLKIVHPSYLPLEVKFVDYEIAALKSKCTYVLTITMGDLPKGVEPAKVQTGWIIIESVPSGASVYINDEFVGNTPLEGYKQAYGKYSYRLEHPNYHPESGTIDLNTGRFEKKVTFSPAFGAISVTSEKQGAKVLLDGKDTGKVTPCTLDEVPSGQHSITLQLDMYAPYQQKVNVSDGQTTKVEASMDAKFAEITIQSTEGAQIYCNGNQIGTSSYKGNMREGYYDIEVQLTHHKASTQQIQVKSGQPQQITITPTPIYGSLDIVSTPRDAEVIIDGKSYGKTPLSIEKILEGEHKVILKKEGYSSSNKTIDISEGKSESLQITLNKGLFISLEKDMTASEVKELLSKCIDESDTLIVSGSFGSGNDMVSGKLYALCEFIKAKNIKCLNLLKVEDEYLPYSYYAWDKTECLDSICIRDDMKMRIDKSIDIYSRRPQKKYVPFDQTSWFKRQPDGVVYLNNIALGYKGEMPDNTEITIREGTTCVSSEAFIFTDKLVSVVIPESVTEIGNFSFYNCQNLSTVSLPNTIKEFGTCSFYCCPNLPVLNGIQYAGTYAVRAKKNLPILEIREGTLYLGNGIFLNCTNLEDIHIPESVKCIGNHAFVNCKKLSSVYIPSSVTSIGTAAFRECTSLTSITIPSSVTSIGSWAFSGCFGLTSVTIPECVTSIGEDAFAGCSGLTSVTIPECVTSIGGSAFTGCSGLNSITIPEGVTSIGSWAFSGCSGLASITIPEGVMSIGDGAFQSCNGLTSITIPESVSSIGDRAFAKCSGLTSITIPESVTSIGTNAFSECPNLKNIYCYSPRVSVDSKYTREIYYSLCLTDEEHNNITLHVPSSAIEYYKKTRPWNKFKNIVAL